MNNRIIATITAGLILASSGAAFAASGTTLAGGANRAPAHQGMQKKMMKAPMANSARTGGQSGAPGRS